MTARVVTIHYHRPPDRLQHFRQPVLHEAGDHVVTFLEAAPLPRPVAAGGRTVLEPGAPIVWFTYPGLQHDVGRFHLADGTFTGVYANILMPVRMEGDRWETTDLFLDVWVGADGGVELLDEDELAEAERNRWLDAPTAAAARAEADRLMELARLGDWPPRHVHEWDLDRARARLSELQADSDPEPPSDR